jgi:hypothetical protein
MDRAFVESTRSLGLPSGDCATNGFAIGPYGREDEGNWGKIACHADNESAYIRWTNEDLRIVASATARSDSDNELYRWWQKDGGPLPTSNLKTFPNAREKDLLDWIPASQRKKCDRSSWGGPSARASISCRPRGVDALGYASYNSDAEMTKAHAKRIGTKPKSDESPCSAAGRAGDSTYGVHGQTGGRLVCYVTDGTAVYEWTLDGSHVTVFAKREDGNLRALFRWWLNADLPEGFVRALD